MKTFNEDDSTNGICDECHEKTTVCECEITCQRCEDAMPRRHTCQDEAKVCKDCGEPIDDCHCLPSGHYD